MAIDTIPNRYPNLNTTVTLTTGFVAACPHSGEPQAGSTVSVTYQPKENLIGLRAIRAYLDELTGGNDPLDLETVVQLVAMACREALGEPVEVKGDYRLRDDLGMVCSTNL